MKHHILIIIFTALTGLVGAAEEPPALGNGLDLSWVVQQVIKKNPDLRGAQAEVDMAEAEALMAYAWAPPKLQYEWMGMGWPQADLGAAMGRKISLTQELPFLGRTLLKGRVASHAAMRVVAMRRMEMEKILAEAREAWYGLMAADWTLRALRVTREATSAMTQLSLRRGSFGQLDRMGQFMNTMLSMEDSDVESMEPMARQQRAMAEAKLNRLMGAPADRALPSPATSIDAMLAETPPTAEELKKAMSANNPELEEAKHHLSHARQSRNLAYSGWLPDLMLGGSVTQFEAGGSESEAMVGVSLPWLWFWGQAGEAGAAGALVKESEAKLDSVRVKLSEDCRVALGEWRAAHEALRVSWTKTLPMAEKGFNLAQAGFKTGALGPSEILMALQDYRMANEKLASLIAAYGKSVAMLEMIRAQASAAGAPTMEMNHD